MLLQRGLTERHAAARRSANSSMLVREASFSSFGSAISTVSTSHVWVAVLTLRSRTTWTGWYSPTERHSAYGPLPPRTWIPDDAIQLADLAIDAGHLLAPDMEVAEIDVRTLPDQVVEDSPHARIPDALLFYTCHIKEQGRCRVGIATIDGVLVGMEMGNGVLRICLHHVTSFQAL